MHARSALFDLYGDHLTSGGNWTPIAGIVRLLGPVDVTPPAVRTAVSRMVRQGWLEPSERRGRRGYAASVRTLVRLAEARARIYRTRDPIWDGLWHVIIVEHPSDRAVRRRVGASMGYLGYSRLAPDTWVAARVGADLADPLAAEKLGFKQLFSRYVRGSALAAELWDLEELAATYRRFIGTTRELAAGLVPTSSRRARSPSVPRSSTTGAGSSFSTPTCRLRSCRPTGPATKRRCCSTQLRPLCCHWHESSWTAASAQTTRQGADPT